MDFRIQESENKIEVIMTEANLEVARASCFIQNTPTIKKEKIGTIGEIECDNAQDGENLLEKCCEILKEKNFKYVVGPMNGNTWNKYRCIRKTTEEPEVLLENVDKKELNSMFKKAGFKELHTYTSTKGKIKDAYSDKILDEMYSKIKKEGFSIRTFNKANAHDELEKIFEVAKISFTRNPLYTDINKEEFIGQYEKYISMCNEKLILIAEKDGKPIGFLFSMPDFNMSRPNEKVTTLILKTIAIIPEYEDYSIGNIMLNEIRKTSIDLGFTEWIFAFMYKNNTSQRMAQRNNTTTIREYSLYGKDLV